MRLERISLKGILRFENSLSIDLRDIPPGLIAVVGENGGGKTTFIESPIAALYRQFPSRSDREVVDYATAGDSYIEIEFALDGDGLYRARLNLDALHRRSDAVLQRIAPDGSARVLTDGKLTSFDAAIAQLLPPLPSLLASVFSAQNRAGSFVTLDRKGRKELFAALLGLEAYDTWAERAKTAAGLVQLTIDRLQVRREILARDAGDDVDQQLQAEADRLQTDGGSIEARRVDLQRDLTTLEATLTGLQEAAAAHAAAQSRVDRVEVEIQSGTLERDHALAALQRLEADAVTERQALEQRLAEARGAIDRALASTTERTEALALIDRQLAKDLGDLDARIGKNRTVLEHEQEIRAAVLLAAGLETDLARGREDAQRLGDQIETQRTRERVLGQTLADLAAKARDLDRARTDARLLGSVPCAGAGEYAVCQLLTSAAAAQAQIAGLEEACASTDAAQRERAQVETAIGTLVAQRQARQKDLTQTETARVAAQKVAARLADLNAATDRIAGHEARQGELEADAVRRRAEASAREERRVADLHTRRQERDHQHAEQGQALERRVVTRAEELTATVEALAERLTARAIERDGLRDQLATTKDASDQAAAQTALLTLRRLEWDASTAALARVTAQREDLTRRREALRDRREELTGLETAIAGHTADVLDWQLLTKALGRDGLQTLEIDAAGPTVSAFCNDLLQFCFGSRFSVELVTQEAKATKSKDGATFKEVFELRVFDSARGGDARDLADLSGGEQVLVDEALKSAIALLVNARNQHPMRTCWRDETTGALDGENAAKYVDMLRRVQQLGGFQYVLFVSHNPDAAMQADAQVRIGGGRIDVVTPPYSEAAA